MLILSHSRGGVVLRAKQQGVVLLISLIMLVAMTLAAIALMRSVDTTNLVAGNLAFQQSTVHFADAGTEQAIAYLYSQVTNKRCSSTGGTPVCVQGFKSWHEANLEPPTAASWDAYWTSMTANPGVVALTNQPSGYSGAFVIEAWCTADQMNNCILATTTTTTTTPQGQDMGSQNRAFTNNNNVFNANYYRITTRVQGPRNSVGYVQVFVAAQ